MAKVRIITDVTANLASELIEQFRITVLPVEIRFGDQTFQIDRDTNPYGLFQEMASGPAQPSAASIAPHLFEEAFRSLCAEASDVLVILSSSKLNGAYAHATKEARAFLGRCRITILDSLTASWGLGLVVEAAARAADAGKSADEIVRLVRGILPHIYLVFFVERLDYLERGGRIRPAQALLGTMLRIKPLLFIEDGDIIPLEKVRTRLMALEKVADFVAEFAAIDQVVILSSPLEGLDSEMIDKLKEILSLSLPDREFPVVEYDPVLACHLGPEALGVIVYEGA